MELGKGRATNHLNCFYWKLAWIYRLAIGRKQRPFRSIEEIVGLGQTIAAETKSVKE
jgi:hypothetical protein